MTELAPPFLRVPLRRAPRKDAVLEPRPPKGVGLSGARRDQVVCVHGRACARSRATTTTPSSSRATPARTKTRRSCAPRPRARRRAPAGRGAARRSLRSQGRANGGRGARDGGAPPAAPSRALEASAADAAAPPPAPPRAWFGEGPDDEEMLRYYSRPKSAHAFDKHSSTRVRVIHDSDRDSPASAARRASAAARARGGAAGDRAARERAADARA